MSAKELDCCVDGGRVQTRGVYRGAMHLFGSVAPDRAALQSSYLPIPQAGQGWWPKCPPMQPCGRTWVVSTTCSELQRTDEGVALAPLDEALFETTNALPALVSRSFGRTQIKAVITANVGSGERKFFLDVGQAIELQALSVAVDWMAPGNATNQFIDVGMSNASRPTPIPTRVGLVVDALVGVEVAIIENPIGIFEGVFTNHLFVTANTRGTIVVPPYAREVTIYQAATLGNASTQWEMHYGDPALIAPTVEHGTIPFMPGQRKTEPDINLGDVTHLRTDQDNAARFFTLRWTIRP